MNDEQLLAWFILEGYQAWNWRNTNALCNTPYTVAKEGQTDGWVTNGSWETFEYKVNLRTEKPYHMSVVNKDVLRLTYRAITGEWP